MANVYVSFLASLLVFCGFFLLGVVGASGLKPIAMTHRPDRQSR